MFRENQGSTEFEQEKSRWKNFTVNHFGASGAVHIGHMAAGENAYYLGHLLAEKGYNGINGGYGDNSGRHEMHVDEDGGSESLKFVYDHPSPTGSMAAFGEGYNAGCDELNVPTEERKDHLFGAIIDPTVSPGAIEERGLSQNSTQDMSAQSVKERARNIYKKADISVATEGGVGTLIEWTAAGLFETEYSDDPSRAPFQRPIILIDSDEGQVAAVAELVTHNPRALDKMTDEIYVLAGHKVPEGKSFGINPDGHLGHRKDELEKDQAGVRATTRNDEFIQRQLEDLLEYYQLKRDRESLNQEDQERLSVLTRTLFDNDSPVRVRTLLEVLKNYASGGVDQAIDIPETEIENGFGESRATIVTGSDVEALHEWTAAAQTEWFRVNFANRQIKAIKKKNKALADELKEVLSILPPPQPVVVFDKTGGQLAAAKALEKKTPAALSSLTEHTYFIATDNTEENEKILKLIDEKYKVLANVNELIREIESLAPGEAGGRRGEILAELKQPLQRVFEIDDELEVSGAQKLFPELAKENPEEAYLTNVIRTEKELRQKIELLK